MKASERLAERNDILLVINQIDQDLSGNPPDQLRAELLETRRDMGRELRVLGFAAPDLPENLSEDALETESVVAKRRIGPPGEIA